MITPIFGVAPGHCSALCQQRAPEIRVCGMKNVRSPAIWRATKWLQIPVNFCHRKANIFKNCSSKFTWWEDFVGNCRGGALGAYPWPCLGSPGATFATFFLSVDEKFNLHCALHNQYQSSMSRLVLLGFRLTYSLCYSGPIKAEDMRYGGHLGSWETLRENFWRGGQNGQQWMR